MSKLIRPEPKMPIWWQRQSVRKWIWRASVYAILILIASVMVLPLYWLIASSLKFEWDLFKFPPQWIPNPATLNNYLVALTSGVLERTGGQAVVSFSLPQYIFNTLIIIIANMIFGVSISALVAYALARLRFRGRDIIFYSVIGALFMPAVVFIVPRFVIFSRLNLINTFWPLIVPAFFGFAGQIFFMRQYFITISTELEDAVYVDGCSIFRF
ncbi:MAG: hypothetical protein GTO18_10260 [Anaerolineales bacterium]|nr:hypothetical protein [Anaerolineales bacterium]